MTDPSPERPNNWNGQAELLAYVGKMVMQWNYAEHIARQMIRKTIPGGHINDPNHLQLSKRDAKWIEDELKDTLLPTWKGSLGEPYLRSVADAFATAREYRNHYVHGLFSTHQPVGKDAVAVIHPARPYKGKTQAITFANASEIRDFAIHLEKLGHYACDVNNAFDAAGCLVKRADGTPAASCPTHSFVALPPLTYQVHDYP